MTKWKLVQAFHPKIYEDNVWRVQFAEIGAPMTDRHIKSGFVTAKNRKDAIKKFWQSNNW